MSLLVDPDYAIYALRLAYLRKIDDHVGPRILTFPSILNLPPRDLGTPSRAGAKSSFTPGNNIGGGLSEENSVLYPLPANSHVVIAGLNDARYQPELATLHSPKINSILSSTAADERTDLFGPSSRIGSETHSQSDWSGADGSSRGKGSGGGLKYTSTILGPGRTGALGMRVNGRRTTSGDTSRRVRLGSKGDSLPEEDTTEEQVSDVEDASKQSADVKRRNNLPSVQFDALPQSGLNVEKNRILRSSSFRMPEGKSDHATALAMFRNRSSSQPHHPAVSSGLRPVIAVDEEDASTTEGASTLAE